MPSHAELETIRKLSQYRPFERGGQDAAEAQEDLVLAALAEAGGKAEGVAGCRAAVATLFGLDLDDIETARAIGVLLQEGRVDRDGQDFLLAPEEHARLATAAEESQAVAAQAIREWLGAVAEQFPGIAEAEEAALREDLESYLRVVIQRHGVEAALLLYPDEAEAQRLYEDLEELGFDFLPARNPRLHEIRGFALSHFMRKPTDAQRAFLSQNLNTGYFWTVLSIDPEGARLVQKIAQGQRVYLDTNFLFRLLGIQGPRFIRPAEILLERTQSAGYQACVTLWTLEELKRRLRASRDFLKRFPVPPREYAALAADATSDEDFVTMYWRRTRDEPGLTVDDFLAYFEEAETHLANLDVPVHSEGCDAVSKRHKDIHDEVSILENVSHSAKQRPLRTLQHDVMHRLLIEKRRGHANRTFATAGAWFLTHDSVLPRYDNVARRGTSELPFCVSAGSWFQVVEAFTPKSGDLGQTLADMLASPYVRYRRTLSKESAQAVVARTHLHADGTPELAARLFMNSAALDQIESATTPEEQAEKIDSALLAAARDAQEEARRAKEQADVAREKARRAEEAAEERAREAERQQADAVERERALRDEAIRNEVARSRDAIENERARAESVRQAEAARYGQEVNRARHSAARQAALARRTKRRLRLLIAFLVATAAFIIAALAGGLEAAWGYVIAVGVLIGVAAALDQFLNRRDEIPEEDQDLD